MTPVLSTAALRANLLSGDRQVVGNTRVILDDREQAVGALVAITEALEQVMHLRVRRCCVTCGCLLLPRDRRCPGCDAKAGRHFDRKVG